jgi:hypothetical protein
LDEGVAAYKRGDYASALREWRPLAKQGNAKAQNNLGIMYSEGLGVPQDDAEALQWYRKAAEQGDADGQFNLGLMYANGEGVPQDYARAVKWYRKAAEQGHAIAQNNLGLVLSVIPLAEASAQIVTDTIFCLRKPENGCQLTVANNESKKLSDLPIIDRHRGIYFMARTRNAKGHFVHLAIARTGECYNEKRIKRSNRNWLESTAQALWDRIKNWSLAEGLEWLGVGSVERSIPTKGSVRLDFIKPDEDSEIVYTYRYIQCPGKVYGIAMDSNGEVFPGNNNLKSMVVTD